MKKVNCVWKLINFRSLCTQQLLFEQIVLGIVSHSPDPDLWLAAHTLDLMSSSNSSGIVLSDVCFYQLQTKQSFKQD